MALHAEVLSRQALVYTDAGPADRPRHVRAGSTLLYICGQLLVFQDDALFAALIDPATGRVATLPLPSPGLPAVFDGADKARKPDLEAAFVLDRGARLDVVAIGSGSTPARERWLVIRDWQGERSLHWQDAAPLYARLRARTEFCGAELNLEGALALGEDLLLVQRGNGAATPALPAIDAVGRLALAEVRAWLDAPQDQGLGQTEGLGSGRGQVPELTAVHPLQAGSLDGVRLTLTDLTSVPGRTRRPAQLLAIAAAEASPDTYRDGEVVGAAVGLLVGVDSEAGTQDWAVLVENGQRFVGKPEGVALDPDVPGSGWLVLDADDPQRPAELCRFRWWQD